MQNAQREHSAILSTCIKLPFVIKIFVLSIFERLFYTGFTVSSKFGCYTFQIANNVGADQTTWMHRLICAFVCTQQNQIKNYNSAGPRRVISCESDCWSRACELCSILAQSHTFVEIDHEIFSMVIILDLWLIQDGLLSVTRESMCTGQPFRLSLLRKKSLVSRHYHSCWLER